MGGLDRRRPRHRSDTRRSQESRHCELAPAHRRVYARPADSALTSRGYPPSYGSRGARRTHRARSRREGCPRRGHQDGRRIEPARPIAQPSVLHERPGQPRQPALLARLNRLQRPAVVIAGARLYLDEDENLTVSGDEIDLPVPGPHISAEDNVTAGRKCGGDGVFTGATPGPAVHGTPIHGQIRRHHAAPGSTARQDGANSARTAPPAQSSVNGCCLKRTGRKERRCSGVGP